jgi:hypothetical protein
MNARALPGLLSLACLASVACGHAAPASRPPLASAGPHVRSDAERRADACGRTDLVALEGPVVVGPVVPVAQGLVRSVRVLDAAGQPVETRSRAIEAIRRDAELDAEGVREAIRRLWREGRFDDVVVETSRDRDGVAVILRVTPRRAMERVFVGAADEADAAALGLTPGRFYDPVALVSAQQTLRRDAAIVVSSSFANAEHTAIDVCVRVDRGRAREVDRARRDPSGP